MMASPSELTLDCKPHSYSLLLKSFGEQTDQTQKLEEFLSRLEEERLKIDAFKRELPLCMQLLSNAMEASRQQLQTCRANNQGPRPVLEEFMPLKHSSSECSEKATLTNMSDKANWMTSVQLWSQGSDGTKQQYSTTLTSPKEEIGFGVSPKLCLDNKQRNGGAFLPFSKERNSCPSRTLQALSDLALANSVDKEMEDNKCSEIDNGISGSRRENSAKIEQGQGGNIQPESQTTTAANTGGAIAAATTTAQAHRKARRCWSPDLHRRFVQALQMLGGSQVATPKQIRELMKVDGLTNDEVKSHLQKYRLHTRRPPPPQAAGTPAPQLVVLGGIWVPPEYATAAAATHGGAPPTLYGAHPNTHASPHYCAAPVPQEFYPAPPPQLPQAHHQLHHPTFHHQLHMYKASPQTQSSPESDLGGAGDRSESIEDGKSESNSWKGDSGGENGGGGGEKKGLAALRDDREESNASEITLKF